MPAAPKKATAAPLTPPGEEETPVGERINRAMVDSTLDPDAEVFNRPTTPGETLPSPAAPAVDDYLQEQATNIKVGPSHVTYSGPASQLVDLQRQVEVLTAELEEARRDRDAALQMLSDYQATVHTASEPGDYREVTPTMPGAPHKVVDQPPAVLGGPQPVNPPLT